MIEQALREVRALLDARLGRVPAPVAPVAEHLRGGHGKCIRAALLLTLAADESDKLPPGAVPCGAAVEMLHLATLVHDDIIDEADTRRGRASVVGRFGPKTAVIAGDYLLCMALQLAAGVPVSGDTVRARLDAADPDGATGQRTAESYPATGGFVHALQRLCTGELREFAGTLEMRETEYLRVIAGKTAALIGLSARLGAELAGQPPRAVERLARFGFLSGMVFQLIDDCIDYEADPAAARKPTGQDIRQGVVTLPLIRALSARPALRGLAADVLAGGPGWAALLEGVSGAGGVADTRALAARYAAKAHGLLAKVEDDRKRRRLEDWLDRILNRKA